MRYTTLHLLAFALAAWLRATGAAADGMAASPYAAWSNGPPARADFFPIAVWLQAPANAERYRQAGFNTYVGLWNGPTEDQLSALKRAGLQVICDQNEVGRRHLQDPTIIGWMHGDEPDNAQSLGEGKGYGPPIPASKIVSDYAEIRSRDPSRPVLLNLGQGVAWDGWYGRGVRSNHPEDYPEYLQGGDIVSFDIYPANHDRQEVAGQLWFVAQGVERLVRWSGGRKIVWSCLECTAISDPARKPTPLQVRTEAWMALIHGSRGLIYFVHQFQPRFREAALFDDPEMLKAVTALNREIRELSPVLNEPAPASAATVRCENAETSVAVMTRRHAGATYVFAVEMRGQATRATLQLPAGGAAGQVEVLGEDRAFPVREGGFADSFEPWAVHLYRVRAAVP